MSDEKTEFGSVTARAMTAAPAPQFTGGRIASLRKRLTLSQTVFAQALNVSAETVRAWEQGKRRPDGAALRLLQFAEASPDLVLSTLESTSTRRARAFYQTELHDRTKERQDDR